MKPDKQSLEKKQEQQREKPWAYVVKKKVKVRFPEYQSNEAGSNVFTVKR